MRSISLTSCRRLAHDVGIKDLLDLFYMLYGGREVTLYAITIDPQQPITLDLSVVMLPRLRSSRSWPS
jgi:hypothetical protein